jgi:iron complex outermembrane receptor protein
MYAPRRLHTSPFILLAVLSSGALADSVSILTSPVTTAQRSDTLPPVVISGRRSDDYRVDHVDTPGLLGNATLQDLPFSIGILPTELIENSMARNFSEVSKYLPLLSFQEQQGPQILRPQTRGMQGGNFQNSRLDGMTTYVTVANALEQFQQIEALNGVPASLYGPANPSGMVNFIS